MIVYPQVSLGIFMIFNLSCITEIQQYIGFMKLTYLPKLYNRNTRIHSFMKLTKSFTEN